MKNNIVLISILIFTSATIVIGFLGIVAMSYEFQKSKLVERYDLPYGLNLDFWGYDISQENYGLVITDSVGGLVLYPGKLIGPALSINKLTECCITKSSVVFKATMSDGNVSYIVVDMNQRSEILSETEYLNIKSGCIKQMLLDQKLIGWLNFKNESHINSFVVMFLFCGLFGLNCFFWFKFIQRIKPLVNVKNDL